MAKILLVDDAAFMRMMLKNTLTQAGYTDLIEAALSFLRLLRNCKMTVNG